MKPHVRKLLWRLRDPILGLLVLAPLFWIVWMGWIFVQAVDKFDHLYEINMRLWEAAGEGKTALVVYWLGEGADANYSDAGLTVLQNAVGSDNPRTVAALLRAGANPNEEGHYPPACMAKEGHKEAIVTLLKKAGAKEFMPCR